MRFRLCVLTVALTSLTACGGKGSPTAPSSTPSGAPTRIIDVSGNGAFGDVNVGDTATTTITVSNSGNSTLTFTSLQAEGGTGSEGYAASPTSGNVPAGGSLPITLQFAPTQPKFYSHVLKVIGNQTSGNNAINISGTGINNHPIFTRSGTGDDVFDLPSYVTRVRITASYGGYSSNFVVYIAGHLVVNELIGTGWGSTSFAGTYAIAGGGTVQIQLSNGVAWTMTEIR